MQGIGNNVQDQEIRMEDTPGEDLLPSQIIEEFVFNNNEEWLPLLSDADMEMLDLNYLD